MTTPYRHDKDLARCRRSTQTICTASVWTCHQTRRRKSTVMWWMTRTGRTEKEAWVHSLLQQKWVKSVTSTVLSQPENWATTVKDFSRGRTGGCRAAAPIPKPTPTIYPTPHPHQDRNYDRDFVYTSGLTWMTLRPNSATEIRRLVGILWNI